ncbi:AIPR family protein [Helicobacter cetorum]|uniref:AIPR family protein n=1 Tax=Helicobacter cetorum TaxID=138563 RepID=UPI0018F81500|nr:AIPR family protein [Helicobacter cetorum]
MGVKQQMSFFINIKKKKEKIDNVEMVIKVIATKDKTLKKDIIYSANNQNAIDKDLQSLNEYHEKIENFFMGQEGIGLFFERLRGQYSDIIPPYKK